MSRVRFVQTQAKTVRWLKNWDILRIVQRSWRKVGGNMERNQPCSLFA